MMSSLLLAAAVLLIGIGVAHSYLGERYILIRLFRRSDLPHIFGSDEFTRRTLRFAWHITTLAWFGFAALLFVVAKVPGSTVSVVAVRMVVSGTFLSSAVLSFVGSRGRHYSWVVFLAVALLAFVGSH